MTNSKTAFAVAFAALAIIVFSVLGYAALAGADNEPGGSSDPLVTQSYVDQYMQWQVIELTTGQTLLCSAGAEFIPRRGQLIVVDPLGNGIPDITGGADIYEGSAAPLNHLLIVPRDDGRGVLAVAPAVVMCRGSVTVRN